MLYTPRHQEKEPVPINCYTGFVVNERILLYKDLETVPIEIGFKKFHCIRRFSQIHRISQCTGCFKDINKDCFYLHKQYYSRQLLEVLIKLYTTCKEDHFCGAISPENKYFKEILKNLYPPKVEVKHEIKEDYYQRYD